jgi:hypothetical protein
MILPSTRELASVWIEQGFARPLGNYRLDAISYEIAEKEGYVEVTERGVEALNLEMFRQTREPADEER